jgi:membrane protein DedA with SNARE-associated domain
MVTKLLESLGKLIIIIISSTGYFGVFFLMALESMIAPIPSELVMPFAGFLAADGRFSFTMVVVSSSLGSIVGSLISYYMGKYGGNPLVIKFGKYLFLDVSDLKKTEAWFARRGEKTIFISRFIPVVRHLISIPAGIGKMNLPRFCIYTVIGATLWNTFLAYLGYVLGQNWPKVRHYSEYFSKAAALILVVAFVWFAYRHIRNKRQKKTEDLQ